MRAIFAVLVALPLLHAQERQPRFEDYPVAEAFMGTPAAPIFVTREQRLFQTVIRDGAARGANFAGHYAVVRWNCGSPCYGMAIVDVNTGQVYGPPLAKPSSTEVPLDYFSDREILFQRDSSLMILKDACRVFRDECGVYYFRWQNNRFDLLKFVRTESR